MSGQEPGLRERTRSSRLYALLFNAITRAIPRDRFVSLSERQAVTDAVVDVLQAVEELPVPASTSQTGGSDLRTRIAEALRQHQPSFTTDAANDYECCADAVLPIVQAELAAKDARIAAAHEREERWEVENAKLTVRAEQAEAERDRLRAELLTWLPRLGAHLDLGPEHDPMAMAMLGGTVKLAMKALYAALDQAPAEQAQASVNREQDVQAPGPRPEPAEEAGET